MKLCTPQKGFLPWALSLSLAVTYFGYPVWSSYSQQIIAACANNLERAWHDINDELPSETKKVGIAGVSGTNYPRNDSTTFKLRTVSDTEEVGSRGTIFSVVYNTPAGKTVLETSHVSEQMILQNLGTQYK